MRTHGDIKNVDSILYAQGLQNAYDDRMYVIEIWKTCIPWLNIGAKINYMLHAITNASSCKMRKCIKSKGNTIRWTEALNTHLNMIANGFDAIQLKLSTHAPSITNRGTTTMILILAAHAPSRASDPWVCESLEVPITLITKINAYINDKTTIKWSMESLRYQS